MLVLLRIRHLNRERIAYESELRAVRGDMAGSVPQGREQHPARQADRGAETVGELLGEVGESAQRPQGPRRRPGRVAGPLPAPRTEEMGERIGDLEEVGARHQIFAYALLQRDEEVTHALELVLQ